MQQQNKAKPSSYAGLFLLVVIVHLSESLFLNTIGQKFSISLTAELIISEGSILIPGLIWMLIHNASFREDLGFRRIKIGTIFMTILLSYLIMPLVSLVNLISQLFTKNEVLGITSDFFNENTMILIFIMGFFGPFCEEFIFRGIIGQGMKRYGSIIATAIVSGLYFGLMHMNLNQFCYAFVLGVIFQIVNYASNSVYTSMIMHTVVNTHNVLLMIVAQKAYDFMGLNIEDMDLQETVAGMGENGYLYYAIGLFLILSVIFTAVSFPVFAFIAKNEGHPDAYYELLERPDEENQTKRWYINVWSIIAVVLCVFVIFFLDLVLKQLGV